MCLLQKVRRLHYKQDVDKILGVIYRLATQTRVGNAAGAAGRGVGVNYKALGKEERKKKRITTTRARDLIKKS